MHLSNSNDYYNVHDLEDQLNTHVSVLLSVKIIHIKTDNCHKDRQI